MNNLISIVVPVFNVENWIPQCMNSILRQSLQKFEVIFINDGSLDRSGLICEEYANKDNRVKVIHKENSGVSSARNQGIEAATGKYIVFIDPDDRIHENYLERLLNIAEKYECNAVVCGYKTSPNNTIIKPGFNLNRVMSGRELILSSSNVHSKNDLAFSWRYMYKLDLIKEKKIKFNEGVSIGEDVIFNLEFLLFSSRVYAIPDSLYLYTVNNSESAMRKPYKANLEKSLLEQYKIKKYFTQEFQLDDYEHYKKDLAYYYINNIYQLMVKNAKSKQDTNMFQALWRISNYEMISKSLKEIGFFYKCSTYKEFLSYLALKCKIIPLLLQIYGK